MADKTKGRRRSKAQKLVSLTEEQIKRRKRKAKKVAEAHKKAIGKKLGQPGFYKAVQEATGTGGAGKPRSAKARAAQEKKIKEESAISYKHPLSSQDVSKIIAYAGKKGKKAAEEVYGKRVVKQAQRTMSEYKPAGKLKRKKPRSPLEGPGDVTPELTGKDLKMSAGGKVNRKAGGKVMTGSELVASLYD